MVVRLMASLCTCCCQGCYDPEHHAHQRVYTAQTYPYYYNDIWCCYFYYPYPTNPVPVPVESGHSICHCTRLCCLPGRASRDDAMCIMIVLLVLAVIGLIFSLAFLAFLGFHYVNKYRQLLQRHEQAVRRRVKDLGTSHHNPAAEPLTMKSCV